MAENSVLRILVIQVDLLETGLKAGVVEKDRL